MNKFEYLMTSIFVNISYKGFCSAEETEKDNGGGDDDDYNG